MEAYNRFTFKPEETLSLCDACGRRGMESIAICYCVDCAEYACDRCRVSHLNSSASEHVMLVGTGMPTRRLAVVDVCPIHSDEKVDHYCMEHSDMLCQMCIWDHRHCDKVLLISQISNDTEGNTQRFDALKESITKTGNRLENIIRLQTYALTKVVNNKQKAKTSIAQFFKTLHDDLNLIQRNVDAEVDIVAEEDKQKVDATLRQYHLFQKELKHLDLFLEVNKGANRKSKSFVALNNAEAQLQNMHREMGEFEETHAVPEIKFEPDEHLKSLSRTLEQLGEFVMKNVARDVKSVSRKSMKRSTRPVNGLSAVAEEGLTIRSDRDTRVCCISSSTVMEDCKTLAVVDNNNDSVKLIDLVTKEIVSTISLDSWPWDVTQVRPNQLAVTLPHARKIQFLSVLEASLTKGTALGVSGECRGIDHKADQLYITLTAPTPQVQVLSITGNVIQSFSTLPDGQSMFRNPYYIAAGKGQVAQIRMYVSDFDNNVVVCLNSSGDVESKYQDDRLIGPEQVAVVDTDVVCVCGQFTSNIHVVSTRTMKSKVLLSQSNGIHNPYSVAFNRELGQLYVGMYNTDTMGVFKIVQH